MHCRTCGAVIETGSRFCAECGGPVTAASPGSVGPAGSAAGVSQPEQATSATHPASSSRPVAARAAGKISAATFGLVLVCFLMPFVSVSCQQQKFVTLTGLQLVTGATLQQPQMFGPPRTQKIDSEPLAILAFLAALVGLVVSIPVGRKFPAVSAVLGVAGAILLFGLKSKLDGEVARQSQGVFHLDYETGFWLTIVLFLGLTVFNAIAHFQAASGRNTT